MNKTFSFLLAALLSTPALALDADPVIVDVYLAGELQQSVSMKGRGSTVDFSLADVPNTRLEMRLVAPEPIIVEFKERSTNGQAAETSTRVKLVAPGNSVAVSEIEGTKFQNPYVLTRPK
jgi:hypothetical protein